MALEEVLDERVSGLESRLTDIDSGAAKKCRLSDLSKETGVRIGEVERRVRQVRHHDDVSVGDATQLSHFVVDRCGVCSYLVWPPPRTKSKSDSIPSPSPPMRATRPLNHRLQTEDELK